MSHLLRWSAAVLVLVFTTGLGCVSNQPVTTATLLAEMTDLRGLAEYPDPPFTCRQFSSYDRKSTTPADAEAWFANADHGQFLRVEERAGRKEYVMMDADGPGAIVRIWSANPDGKIRIYLDGEPTPRIETSLADLLSGQVAGIPEPIAHVASKGWNCYFPIPYARHCKVTSDASKFYYHVNYRTYPPGARVTTFTPAELDANLARTVAVAATLAAPRQLCQPTPPAHDNIPLDSPGPLPPGKPNAYIFRTDTPAAITCVQLKLSDPNLADALQHLHLTIDFDGQRTVACPLGEFFGAAPGLPRYAGLPLEISADGTLWSRWVMPFRREARVEIRNDGPTTLASLACDCRIEPYDWTPATMYFHADRRHARAVPTRPMQDWNYLTARGRGVFVGAAFTIHNPVEKWWGEGDEKIYVDREKFPSHFGTGTEDYYGYAWCCNEVFSHAYHAQPRCDGPKNQGHTAVNRWHVLDRIPFRRAFRFDMELWHWEENCTVDMSVVTYWYGRRGAEGNGQRGQRLVNLQ